MLIELKNINKTYSAKGGVTYRALSNVSLTFEEKGLVFVVGQSGSGKSTLLNVIGGLDSYDSGQLNIGERQTRGMKSAEVDAFRNTMIGFVFQEFNLIDTLSVYDNVKLSLDMQGERDGERVYAVLEEMGIRDKARAKTKNLSGGQRQRVAIARTLVKDPQIVLADEPTGALDSVTGEEVMRLFRKMADSRLVIVVTHDLEMAARYGDRIIEMKDGRVYRDIRRRRGEEGETVQAANVSVISGLLVRLESGVAVNEQDVAQLNGLLAESGRKTYVNVETDPRKVKALFPNLREAVDQHIPEQEEDGALDGTFVPYAAPNSPPVHVEFKRSRFPLAKALRLGLNNLNHKKGRLILTIVMAVFAFLMFGLVFAISRFDMQGAVAKTIQREKMGSVAVMNGGSSYNSRIPVRASEIAKMREQFPEMKFLPQYVFLIPFPGKLPGAKLQGFSGFTEITDAAQVGLSMLHGSGRPETVTEIVISQYAAELLLMSNTLLVGSLEDAVGQRIPIGGTEYLIKGIFRSKDSFYYEDPKHQIFELEADWENTVGQLFVCPGFLQAFIASMAFAEEGFTVEAKLPGGGATEYFSSQITFATESSISGEIDYNGIRGGGNTLERPSHIFISSDMLQTIPGRYSPNQINDMAGKELLLKYQGKSVYACGDFFVRGIYTGPGRSIVVFSDSLLEEIFGNVLQVGQVRTILDGNDKHSEAFVRYAYGHGYVLNEPFTEDYNNIIGIFSVLATVLLVMALIFTALVILLLFNFISSSIRMTRKQIGILRALGARQWDTFAIYALEGLLVALISLGVAALLLAVGCPVANTLISSMYGYYFRMFSAGPLTYLVMTALSVCVALVSVAITIRRFTRITPIDAIAHRE